MSGERYGGDRVADGAHGGAPALRCRGLTVAYDGDPVLRDVDLDVAPGEVVAVLGPSGSGKTTLLYAVAGFVRPADGEIHVDGELVATPDWTRPPEDRRIGLVFQNYALWPHLDAVETVAYPLRRRGVDAGTARERARELLDRMGIGELGARRPSELSGGQQQRVGLARALARDASLYLFDEPTAHLDTALRVRLQEEMARRRADLGAAALHATHDAGEALALADRIVLLREGRVVQVGPPRQVYEEPVDVWAARLTGRASLLEVELADTDLSLGGAPLGATVAGPGLRASSAGSGEGRILALVRPEWAHLDGPLDAEVVSTWYRGAHTDHELETAGGRLLVRHPGPPRAPRGARVGWGLDRAWALPPDGEPAH